RSHSQSQQRRCLHLESMSAPGGHVPVLRFTGVRCPGFDSHAHASAMDCQVRKQVCGLHLWPSVCCVATRPLLSESGPAFKLLFPYADALPKWVSTNWEFSRNSPVGIVQFSWFLSCPPPELPGVRHE